MEMLLLKFALSSASVFCWLVLGVYFDRSLHLNNFYIIPIITLLSYGSIYFAIKKYVQIIVFKNLIERKEFEQIVKSHDILKIRRAIISNPSRAVKFVKFNNLHQL